MVSVGIDGCKSGWVASSSEDPCTLVFKNIKELTRFYGKDAFYLIDIPIGLPSFNVTRECESMARKLLGMPRSASVFNVPCRAAVYSECYADAQVENRKQLGKGLSKQTWNIVAKIKEVDEFLVSNPFYKQIVREAHPELCFYSLNDGFAMVHSKKSAEGEAERLGVLGIYNSTIQEVFNQSLSLTKGRQVLRDDIIDSLCLAVSGTLIQQKAGWRIPAEVKSDDEGIEMSMVFASGTASPANRFGAMAAEVQLN
ncbi:DUF429 domain-containing protein [Telluribacter humicola]|uniref:DUF429 domain-containing protein n=1 Tax=Telluribacter humicola TaxID=1720261 RepID=UPI001A96A511|nr:DUF429 domain-containing protein [Telluribacter humicola]